MKPDLEIPLWFKVFAVLGVTASLSITVAVIWALVELVLWVTR